MNASGSAAALGAMLEGIDAGIKGIGMERFWQPEKVEAVAGQIHEADALTLALLIHDVAGEAVSLGVERALAGPQALMAMSEAWAEVLIDLRESSDDPNSDESHSVKKASLLLEDMQTRILEWIEHGRIQSPAVRHSEEYALNQIARDFLVSTQLRQASMVVTLSACAVMKAAMQLWQPRLTEQSPPLSFCQTGLNHD